MKQSCLICKTELKNSRIPGLLECPKCSFITTNLKLSRKEIKQLYAESYFHGGEYGGYIEDEYVIKKNFNNRLKKLLQFIESASSKSLFEIGCAYGFFLEVAAAYFGKVSGIDICDEAVAFSCKRGVNAACGDFLNMRFKQRFDIFCMWDTIEHLRHPEKYIEKISANIERGGLLAITTGDINSLNARIRGAKWRQIHPPTHLHYFSRKSMSYLLKKNGFGIVYTGHPGQYANLDNLMKILFIIRGEHEFLYRFFKFFGINRFNVYLNMMDLIYIIAKKNN